MRTLRFACILSLLFLCSCATIIKDVANDFAPSDELSIVFGKTEIIHNGQMVGYDETSQDTKKVYTHISKLDPGGSYKGLFEAGDFVFINHYRDAGYFAFTLPPGKYYFSELVYIRVIPDSFRPVDIRTHLNIPGNLYIGSNVIEKPYMITFEVLPNSATYIGTIKHHFETNYANLLAHSYRFGYDLTDEYEDAKKWISSNKEEISDLTCNKTAKIQLLEGK